MFTEGVHMQNTRFMSGALGRKCLTLLLAVILIASFAACAGRNSISYESAYNWAYRDRNAAKQVDLFIIAPTVDTSKNGRTNMRISDKDTKKSFVNALNAQLGIYEDVCNVYAPYYRQMTLAMYEREDYDVQLNTAYQDVKGAFLYYYEHLNGGRPFVLSGFSQGAQLGLKLMEELFDDPKYSDKLVAAYLIGWRFTEEEASKYPWMRAAEGELDTGVIISVNAEAPELTDSLIVPAGTKTLDINPLNWKRDDTPAPASANLGACFSDDSGAIVKEIPALTGAYIDPVRGTVKVTDISVDDYPPVLSLFAAGDYHLYDNMFFYRNLQRNVQKRADAFLKNAG